MPAFDRDFSNGQAAIIENSPSRRAVRAVLERMAGCEKLPEGPMRDNCEEMGDEKKATLDLRKDLPTTAYAASEFLRNTIQAVDNSQHRLMILHGLGLDINKILRPLAKAHRSLQEAHKALKQEAKVHGVRLG